MSGYVGIQEAIEQGRAAAASILGAPYNAYRANAASTGGNFPSGWTLLNNTPVKKTRITDQKIESALKSSGTLFYQLLLDMTKGYQLGDVFVNADPAYGVGATRVAGTTEIDAFSIAWHAPIQPLIGARLSALARIGRQSAATSSSSDGPVWAGGNANASWLTLGAGTGTFTWGPAPGSLIPVGVGSSERPSRDAQFNAGGSGSALPTTVPKSRYYFYLPPLPGYVTSEADSISLLDGSTYIVVQPYAQNTGVVGSQIVGERTLSGV